ncbi:MAG TPA: hypothetical protein VFW44_15915 [Bryobacteraceae bacterium]|nr:hypothetical protein [Bryobacteraceae bacterium]
MKLVTQALSLGLLVGASLTYAGTGAATISLADTPAAVSCDASAWVNHVIISVVPGGEGKVYIGQASQDPGSGAGIAQILFPNAGAHSEQFELADPSGNDTINLCNLYVAGEIPGEVALASWTYKSGASTGNELVLVQAQSYAGPVPSTSPIGCPGLPGSFAPIASTGLLRDSTLTDTDPSYYFDKIRVQVIPGQEGKINLAWCNGSSDGYFHTLFPNTGALWQHSAWSEGWELQDPGGQNGLSMYDGAVSGQPFHGWGFVPDLSSEGLQVALWQLQNAGSVVDPTSVYAFSGTSGAPPATFTASASRLRFRVEPGYCGKFYFGNTTMDPAAGTGLYKTLFPNCIGGWSEEFVAIPDSTVNVPVALGIAAEFATDAISSEALTVSPYGGSPTTSSQSVGGGATVLAATPAPIGTGSVHRVTISVTPGQEGQVFIGTSALDTALDGAIAILYPNTIGRWSEQFDLIDPQGDGIDLSALYIMGEIPGEYVQVVTETTGVTPATLFSVNLASLIAFPGSCTGSTYSYAVPLTGCPGSAPISAVRIQVLPGLDPPVWIGTAGMLSATEPDYSLANTLKILYPNIGDYDIHEGFSETYKISCPDGTNCLTTDALSLWPEYAYYPVLVALWQH